MRNRWRESETEAAGAETEAGAAVAAAAAAAAATTKAAVMEHARVVDVGDREKAAAAIAAKPSRCPYTHALVQYFASCANSFRLFRFYFYCVCI